MVLNARVGHDGRVLLDEDDGRQAVFSVLQLDEGRVDDRLLVAVLVPLQQSVDGEDVHLRVVDELLEDGERVVQRLLDQLEVRLADEDPDHSGHVIGEQLRGDHRRPVLLQSKHSKRKETKELTSFSCSSVVSASPASWTDMSDYSLKPGIK